MKKYSSNMLTYLNQQTTDLVRKNENDKYNIQMIDIRNIVPDEKNFYGIRDIEGLAERILTSKHITPLAIIEDGENYRLMSGERRYHAVMSLIKNGKRSDYAVPCRVYKPFKQIGKLSAEMQEMICIISENDYRTKNILEKYQEITKLEPIYRIFYEESGEKGSFRAFFTDKLGGISESSLQRILSIKNLTPSAIDAVKDGILKDSVTVVLASLEESAQNKFVEQVREGKIEGTHKDIKQFKNDTSDKKEQVLSSQQKEKLDKITKKYTNNEKYNNSSKSEEEDQQSADSTNSLAGKKEIKTENNKKNDSAAYTPPHIDWQDGQKEVDGWLIKKLDHIFHEAVKNSSAANGLDAAKWELCQARIKWVIEKLKSNEE